MSSNNIVRTTDLPVTNTVGSSDRFLIIKVANSSVQNTYSVNAATMFSNTTLVLGKLVVTNRSTPANSTITVQAGEMFSDASYLYVATANNTLMRVSLSSF